MYSRKKENNIIKEAYTVKNKFKKSKENYEEKNGGENVNNKCKFPVWLILLILLFLIVSGVMCFMIYRNKKNTPNITSNEIEMTDLGQDFGFHFY